MNGLGCGSVGVLVSGSVGVLVSGSVGVLVSGSVSGSIGVLVSGSVSGSIGGSVGVLVSGSVGVLVSGSVGVSVSGSVSVSVSGSAGPDQFAGVPRRSEAVWDVSLRGRRQGHKTPVEVKYHNRLLGYRNPSEHSRRRRSVGEGGQRVGGQTRVNVRFTNPPLQWINAPGSF